ncbi:MAG: HIT domain-containing protein [Thermodesulfobacteriota bacterium]
MGDFKDNCVFCEIIRGTTPADKVYEDDLVVAFWDAKPVRPIHILIVPREHIPTLNDVGEGSAILSHIGKIATVIAHRFGVRDSGYRFFINVNAGGGQVVFHLHAHVIAYQPDRPA